MGQYMSKMNKSPAKWINESTWKECLQLSASIPAFSGLCSNIAVNGTFWSKFSTCENPFAFLENEPRLTDDRSTPTDGTLCFDTLLTFTALPQAQTATTTPVVTQFQMCHAMSRMSRDVKLLCRMQLNFTIKATLEIELSGGCWWLWLFAHRSFNCIVV